MKRAVILFLFALTAIVLFGRQPEQETVMAGEVENKTEVEREGLLAEGEIAQVELSEVKGFEPVVYVEAVELELFRNLFSSAEKEPGLVNMSDPDFYLTLVMKDGEKHYLNMWLGGEGEMASLMDSKATHTVYAVTPDIKKKLSDIILANEKMEH
ncbi:hypothetical protein [Planomicrobium okeanokoites]|uniref:YhfM-like domain-containing protein n=1 Tax=Planomicrobium okeanokoites TaxID=244 RepID=A0ABV7KSB5_PLAOK|nr:hypothetical protein [Planomicrobium okeanokoites]TAA70162.1 hypothetical protein D2910_06840 [Planomicrobium okeanokoites]